MKSQTPLVEMIQKANQSDLDSIDLEIAAKEKVLADHKAEVDRLRALRKTIDVIINGKPARQAKAPKASKPAPDLAASSNDRRKKVAEYLAKYGASKPAQICEDLGIPNGSITFVLSTSAFAKTPNGVVLTPEGRQQYLES